MIVDFLLIIKKEDFQLETNRLNLLKFLTIISKERLPILYREIFKNFLLIKCSEDQFKELDVILKSILLSPLFLQPKEIYLFFTKLYEFVTKDKNKYSCTIDIGYYRTIKIYNQSKYYTFHVYQANILNEQKLESLNGYVICSELDYKLLVENIKIFTNSILGYISFDTKYTKYGHGNICVIKDNDKLTFNLFTNQIDTNFKLYLDEFKIKTTGQLIEKTFTCVFNDPLGQYLLTKIKYENPFGRNLLTDYIFKT